MILQSLLMRAVRSVSDGSGSFVAWMSSRRPENAHSRFDCRLPLLSLLRPTSRLGQMRRSDRPRGVRPSAPRRSRG
jgi:hypothetical protein